MTQPVDPSPRSGAQYRMGRGMIYVAWLLALGLVTWLFSGWLDTQRNPNRHVKSVIEDGMYAVTLERNRYGHYNANGLINGREVEFMLDTGATTVSVPAAVAQRLGLKRGPPVLSSTANGTITTYLTRLASVSVGDITLHNVKANINPHMGGNEVLLGMSFLKHLEFTQRGDTLILKQLPQ
ncbi:MAG: TIGR02281 family clan AA aspartic protease [Proteobacteria bacterium]|nr:TIGR02281 family clan AA aspartic protease [Pseudomonadota bacterium]